MNPGLLDPNQFGPGAYDDVLSAFGGLTCRYKLDEAVGTTTTAHDWTAGAHNSVFNSTPTWGQTGLLTDGGTCARCSTSYLQVTSTSYGTSAQTMILFFCWVAGTDIFIMSNTGTLSTNRLNIDFKASTTVSGGTDMIFSIRGVSHTIPFAANLLDGSAHQIIISSNAATWWLWIDGLPVGSFSQAVGLAAAYNGQVNILRNNAGTISQGYLDDIAWSSIVMTDASAALLWAAATA